MTPLTFDQLEDVYERLAAGIDAAGPDREAVFLAKLCMMLAHRLGDADAVRQCIAAAADAADNAP